MPEHRNNILTKLRLQSSVDDVVTAGFWKALVAESFGTFILVFIGLGSCYSDAGLVGAAFAFGLAGALGIWATAPISGGNINPAVSLGLLIARKMSLLRCLFYMGFQFLGALGAAKLISIMTSETFAKVHGLSARNVPVDKALYCEIAISFVLVFTVMRMCVEKSRTETERGVAALAIGISIIVGILCGGNISGGSMNPARSLGPAIANLYFNDIWIYVAGPLIGGALAGLLQQMLFTSELSRVHIVSYLISPNFGNETKYKKQYDDLESNSSTKKGRNPDKCELLEEDVKLQEIPENEN